VCLLLLLLLTLAVNLLLLILILVRAWPKWRVETVSFPQTTYLRKGKALHISMFYKKFTVLCFASIFISSFLVLLFLAYLLFMFYFLFSSFGHLLLFYVVEPASIIVFLFIQVSCDRNPLHWLMYDINLHPLPGTNVISGDITVDGHNHTCCC
jgi:hypothetical protein